MTGGCIHRLVIHIVKNDNVQIHCLHLYPFKDQHIAEKDLKIISIFSTSLICMLAIDRFHCHATKK